MRLKFKSGLWSLLLPFGVGICVTVSASFATAEEEAKKSGDTEITYAQHIAPLVHANCSNCHRPGQAGPFSLLTYSDVSRRALTMQAVMEDRYMPPWHPVDGHGDYKNNRRLTDEQIAMFGRWVEAGKPLGDEDKVPPPPEYKSGWALGEPDMIVKMNGEFKVAADGPDVYRSFVIPMDLKEDKWVTAVELRPQARNVVHHVLLFLDSGGSARAQDGKDGQAGFAGMRFAISGALGGYVPGQQPQHLPDGLALPLPAGSDIVLQTHFHPVGKEETEKIELGLYFSKEPPKNRVVNIQVPPAFGRGMGIDIPAGESKYKIEDTFRVPVDVVAYTVGGHAHYVCQKMEMTATLPDGTVKPLMLIDDWDLDWQDRYEFAEPIKLPAGTELKTTLIYDNSKNNPDNPFSPPQRIRWGRESTDEMGSVSLMVVAENPDEAEDLVAMARKNLLLGIGGNAADRIRDRLGDAGGLGAFFRRLDANGDKKLQAEELPEALRERALERFDKDGNKVLEGEELEDAGRAIRGQFFQ